MKLFSFKLWIPILLVGIILIVSLPAMKESANKGIPTHTHINWQATIGEVCIGLGSIASIIRGAVEFVKLFKKEKK